MTVIWQVLLIIPVLLPSAVHALYTKPLPCSSFMISIRPQFRHFSSNTHQFTLSEIMQQDDHQSPRFYIAEESEKKSRFIGMARHVTSWPQAQIMIAQVKELHPKARHICFGFVAGTHPVQERSSDDGEPSGTAGLPILGAIKSEGLLDTLCIVVRYFGGIKLGAGGLIRAYGSCARLVLRQASKTPRIPTSTFMVKILPSSYAGHVYSVAAKHSALVSEVQYQEDGSVEIQITCNSTEMENIIQQVRDVTRGAATF